MSFGVIVVLAILGCSLSLALSVWARKPFDVIVVVYTIWAIILLAYPVLWLLATLRLLGGPPRWLLMADPFYLAVASYSGSGGVEPADFAWFMVISLAASAALVMTAVCCMRTVSSRAIEGGGTTKEQIWSFHLWLTSWDVMVAYVAFGLTMLTIRSFDGCFGRMSDQIRRTSFIAEVIALSAGGIGIACVTVATMAWANSLYP
jgi:hypothetical protein